MSGIAGVSPLSSVKTQYSINTRISGQGSANMGQPVTPVSPVQAVTRERVAPVQYRIPTAKEGIDPQEAAVRGRINASTEEAQLHGEVGKIKGELQEADLDELQPEDEIAEEKVNGNPECECCKNRRYQDDSNDGSVSFQNPTHISPEESSAKVRAHEQEHVVNEKVYAQQEGKEVINQNVQIQTSTCPECGASYTSGGLTTTVTAESVETAGESTPKENKITLSDQAVDKMMNFMVS